MPQTIFRFPSRLLAPLAIALGAMACGGHIILDAPDGAAMPNSSADDGGDSAAPNTGILFPLCPASAPETGTACQNANQGCVYDNVKENTCASWTCDENLIWELSTPAGC